MPLPHSAIAMPPPPPPPAMPPPSSASASAITTRFANHWAADTFAGDESLEFSVRQELLKVLSESLAGGPEAARERVALRSLLQLSSLIPAGGGGGGDADAAATSRVFRVDDDARSGEDVLLRRIREVEISGSLEVNLLPPFSQDIKETIPTKKTSFQLLKEVDPWITSVVTHNSIPSSSKDRDGESAKNTSNEEKSEDTSSEICVRSKDQDTDDTLEGSSHEDELVSSRA